MSSTTMMADIMKRRRTKIICTLGPASSNEQTITQMMKEGMNAARLNFSHGSYDTHRKTIEMLNKCAQSLNIPFCIIQDLQGPKIRIGTLENHEKIWLNGGDLIRITTDPKHVGNKEKVNTSYSHLVADCIVGGQLLIDDGLLCFSIKEKQMASSSVPYDEVLCEVVVGGWLGEHKGINLPGQKISAPCLTEKDIADMEFGLEMGVDYICMSFVREAADILQGKERMRNFIKSNPKIAEVMDAYRLVPIIAKIERSEAIDNIGDIIKAADGIMVARGDLGVEMAYNELPILQKRLIAKASNMGKIDITATQMLQSMVDNPLPTRAEVTDVANAIFDGTDVIMMSNETATGKYPVKAVQVMAQIAETADLNYGEFCRLDDRIEGVERTERASEATALAAATLARSYDKVKAIVCLTNSGTTAIQLSQYRPSQPIIALTTSLRTYKRLALAWGAIPVTLNMEAKSAKLFEVIEGEAIKVVKLLRLPVKSGDAIALVVGAQSLTNLSKSMRVVIMP